MSWAEMLRQNHRCANFSAIAIAMVASSIPASAQPLAPTEMTVGTCVTRAAMLAGLNAEGQMILIADDAEGRNAADGSVFLQREAYTSNSSFSRGVLITGNARGEFCKTADLHSIKVFDARKSYIDERAFRKPSNHSPSGTLNAALKGSYLNLKQLPMLQAIASNGIMITVVGNVSNQTGGVLFSRDDGAIHGAGAYETVNSKYSSGAISYLDRQ